MFKEFAFILAGFGILYLIFRFWYRKKPDGMRRGLLVLLIASGIMNVIYNVSTVFPEYVYEGVPIGDCRENLFAYKSDSEFQWQILFPMIQNRTVYLDSDDELYREFFELFSREVITMDSEKYLDKKLLDNTGKFDRSISFSAVELLNYAFPKFDDTRFLNRHPYLYVNTSKLKGSDEIAAVLDEDSNLYVMALETYYELMK